MSLHGRKLLLAGGGGVGVGVGLEAGSQGGGLAGVLVQISRLRVEMQELGQLVARRTVFSCLET